MKFFLSKTGTQIQSCSTTSHLPSISTVISLADPNDRNAFNVLTNIKEEPTDVEIVESQDKVRTNFEPNEFVKDRL